MKPGVAIIKLDFLDPQVEILHISTCGQGLTYPVYYHNSSQCIKVHVLTLPKNVLLMTLNLLLSSRQFVQ